MSGVLKLAKQAVAGSKDAREDFNQSEEARLIAMLKNGKNSGKRWVFFLEGGCVKLQWSCKLADTQMVVTVSPEAEQLSPPKDTAHAILLGLAYTKFVYIVKRFCEGNGYQLAFDEVDHVLYKVITWKFTGAYDNRFDYSKPQEPKSGVDAKMTATALRPQHRTAAE